MQAKPWLLRAPPPTHTGSSGCFGSKHTPKPLITRFGFVQITSVPSFVCSCTGVWQKRTTAAALYRTWWSHGLLSQQQGRQQPKDSSASTPLPLLCPLPLAAAPQVTVTHSHSPLPVQTRPPLCQVPHPPQGNILSRFYEKHYAKAPLTVAGPQTLT
jgi:hypothetical protein